MPGATAGKNQMAENDLKASGLESSAGFFIQCLDPTQGWPEDLAQLRLSWEHLLAASHWVLGSSWDDGCVPSGEHLEKVWPESMHSQTLGRKPQSFFWRSLRSCRMSLVLHVTGCSRSLSQAYIPGRGNYTPCTHRGLSGKHRLQEST